jgi:hypothetical protein
MRAESTLWKSVFSILVIVCAHAAMANTSEAAQDRRCVKSNGSSICISAQSYQKDICSALGHFAEINKLPPGFFTRLIWHESGFRSHAVSHAGAQGIAQFMPKTAKIRGLRDPFNPAEALAASASYLAFLKKKFGNWGLAAAAYNAGENRVTRIVGGKASAPKETRNYVAIITGHSLDQWKKTTPEVDFRLNKTRNFNENCLTLAQKSKFRRFQKPRDSVLSTPSWGVQIAVMSDRKAIEDLFKALTNKHHALLRGERLVVYEPRQGPQRFAARIGRDTQKGAAFLCRKLKRAGLGCSVARN